MEEKWIEALVKLYEKQLKLDKNIVRGSKKEKVKGYLEVLEEARQKVMQTKDSNLEKLYKNYYHDLYVIKESDIPYSIYETEVKLERERGYGNIPITNEYIKEKNKEIINNQIESLDKWIEYFLYDDEAKIYAAWEVYWVLEGLQKLGHYDKEKKAYTKRNKNTTYPFPEVNKAAIFNTLNLMEEYLKDKKGPNELKAALGQANFKQLYEYSLNQLMLLGEKKNNGTEGIWVKYNQGSDYHKLRDSLQGYRTGWCTAAGESFAKDQLENGDFYVYYSIDENGEYKIPRIAIRMNGSYEIGEIRGILEDQNMEPEMLPILNEKLKEFPNSDEYYKKEHDMNKLTQIESKVNNKEELTIDELRFLYEIDGKIEGFGWEEDPRIEEIKDKRNTKREDLSKLFNCKPEQIALTEGEIKEDTIYYDGSLHLNNITSAEGLTLPKHIGGSLYLRNLTSTEGLTLPQTIGGNLYLGSLTTTKGLILPQTIGGSLHLNNITSAKGLTLPQTIGGNLYLGSLTTAKGLILPQTIGGSLDLRSLTSTEGLTLPQTIGGSLDLRSLTSAKGLTLPQTIGGSLDLRSLTSAEGLTLPQTIGGSLNLGSLTTAEGLILPQTIGGSLDLSSLTTAEGLILPQTIGGYLDLSSLTTAEGLTLPQTIGGYLDLSSLTTAEGLILPQTIGGSLYLRSLTSAEGLTLPQTIGGSLNLGSLTTAEGLTLPQTVGGSLDLGSLTTAEGLIIPNPLEYEIYLSNFEITPQNVEEYRNKKQNGRSR